MDLKDSEGNTPMHLAVKTQSEKMVETLKKAKADCFVKNGKQETASAMALKLGNQNIIQLIRQKSK